MNVKHNSTKSAQIIIYNKAWMQSMTITLQEQMLIAQPQSSNMLEEELQQYGVRGAYTTELPYIFFKSLNSGYFAFQTCS